MDIFRDIERCANREVVKDAVLGYYKKEGVKVSQDEIEYLLELLKTFVNIALFLNCLYIRNNIYAY